MDPIDGVVKSISEVGVLTYLAAVAITIVAGGIVYSGRAATKKLFGDGQVIDQLKDAGIDYLHRQSEAIEKIQQANESFAASAEESRIDDKKRTEVIQDVATVVKESARFSKTDSERWHRLAEHHCDVLEHICNSLNINDKCGPILAQFRKELRQGD